MENRFSRASSQRSATASDLDDALYPVYTQYRPGLSLGASTSGRRPAPSPSRDYQQARPSSPEDVFADPADSPPPSPSGSAFYSSSIVTTTPSVRRPSLSLSSRRSPSPLPGGGSGGGGGTGYYQHHRISQSLTPSVRSSSSSTYGHGAPLNRSNTTGTTGTGYSTLSSIPSNLSDSTAAGVGPRWNYGGHQQNIYPESINTQGSTVPEEENGADPFSDNYGMPVNDGFAPHRPPPAVVFPSGASSLRSVEPPPYTKYPEPPKPEAVGVPLRLQVSNGDSGIDVGQEGEGEEERRSGVALAAAGGVGLLAATRDRGGDGGEPDDGGHLKEWDEKRVMGFRKKTMLVGLAVAAVILLAVGLGVGLGVGLHHPQVATATATVYPEPTTDIPPTSEETGPPLSSPNDTFPVIPTGIALINPVDLAAESTSCDISTQDQSSPNWFGMGADLLWSCAYDDTSEALKWRFERGPVDLTNMELYPSKPDFLRGAEYGEGVWGGYVVSSAEGITKWEIEDDMVEINVHGDIVEYSGKSSWKDGTQNQAFWKIPFAFYNTTENNYSGRKKRFGSRNTIRHELDKRSTGNGLWSRSGDHPLDDRYKFALLFNKTVIIKQTTIDKNIARSDGIIKSGNGTALSPGEIVWKCVWEKTLLEVEVMADIPSTAVTNQKGTDDDGDEGNDSDDDYDDYDDDDDHTTTISSSTTATPTMSIHTSLTRTHQQSPSHTACPYQPNCPHYSGDASFPNIPPPPPPPSHGHNEDDFFGLKHPPQATETPSTNGNLTYKLRLKRHVERSAPTSYPLKVIIKESRPTSSRIRRLLGMDLTDPDPKGRANLGGVRCTQYVVTVKGGLKPLVDQATGEGYVKLDEIPHSKRRMKERGDSTCYCKWNS